MGQAQRVEYTEIEGITTPIDPDAKLNAIIHRHVSLLIIPIGKIKPYMPSSKGFRVKYLFSVLLSIAGLIRPTKSTLIYDLSYHTGSLIKAVDYLELHGMIKGVKKSRLIIPFGKYKIDKGYVITEKGKNVLRKVLG